MRPSFRVFVSRRGNIFMREIAELLATAIGDLGYDVTFPAPGLPEASLGTVNLVVAPHEFFLLQEGCTHDELLRSAAASTCVGVEQPGTGWYELTVHYASAGRSVLDISHYAVEEHQRRGLDAAHLQLGYHPSWDRWGGDLDRARSTDLLFLGSITQRRAQMLGDAAPLLWDMRSDIRLFEFPRPMSEPTGLFVAGTEKWDLLADSRILLNVHRNEVPYFEWVRALEAVCNGCLLLTEASTHYGPLVAGEHLVAAPVDALGALAASLVLDEPLRREIVASAYDYIRTKLELTAHLAPHCERLASEALLPSVRRVPLPYPATVPVSAQPGVGVLARVHASETGVRVHVKELLDSETELVQTLEALESELRYGDSRHEVVEATPAWDGFEPEISVLITSYNYEHFIGWALDSILSSEGVAAEIVVVDDHSRDGSMALLRRYMDRNSWFPIQLVAKSANAGVGAARNRGFEAARSDRVFVLDADNYVYPSALRKLATALDDQPEAAFAYGMIGRMGEPGLLSHIPWDVTRLLQNNYIDAMALIRKDVWVDVGGYDAHRSSLKGWEDYEFWLRIAAAGGYGTFVPEVLATYRVHHLSRQRTVDLDTESLHAEFRARYPFLPWAVT
jgi:hypothetical protein